MDSIPDNEHLEFGSLNKRKLLRLAAAQSVRDQVVLFHGAPRIASVGFCLNRFALTARSLKSKHANHSVRLQQSTKSSQCGRPRHSSTHPLFLQEIGEPRDVRITAGVTVWDVTLAGGYSEGRHWDSSFRPTRVYKQSQQQALLITSIIRLITGILRRVVGCGFL